MSTIINQAERAFSAPVLSNPLGDNLQITKYPYPQEQSVINIIFTSRHIWSIPYDIGINNIIKADIDTGVMTEYVPQNGINGNSGIPNNIASRGFNISVFDGTHIWVFPVTHTRGYKINVSTGTITGFEMKNGLNGSTGIPSSPHITKGIVHNGSIWVVHYLDPICLINIDPATMKMTGYPLPFDSLALNGVYDGDALWVKEYNT